MPPHLALHDHLSGSRVVRDPAPARLPAWARGWLALQAIATVLAIGWGLQALQAAVDAALLQALGPA